MQGYWPLLGPSAFLSLPVYQCQEVAAAHPAVLPASHPSASLLHPALGMWGDTGLHHHAGVVQGCHIPELHFLTPGCVSISRWKSRDKESLKTMHSIWHKEVLPFGGAVTEGDCSPSFLPSYHLLPFPLSHAACLLLCCGMLHSTTAGQLG